MKEASPQHEGSGIPELINVFHTAAVLDAAPVRYLRYNHQ
jgi:hypothetical protein